jgi:hypothetical protein
MKRRIVGVAQAQIDCQFPGNAPVILKESRICVRVRRAEPLAGEEISPGRISGEEVFERRRFGDLRSLAAQEVDPASRRVPRRSKKRAELSKVRRQSDGAIRTAVGVLLPWAEGAGIGSRVEGIPPLLPSLLEYRNSSPPAKNRVKAWASVLRATSPPDIAQHSLSIRSAVQAAQAITNCTWRSRCLSERLRVRMLPLGREIPQTDIMCWMRTHPSRQRSRTLPLADDRRRTRIGRPGRAPAHLRRMCGSGPG